jgi:hypothetical protein
MKIIKLFRNPYKIFSYFGNGRHFKWMPDKMYLKCVYRGVFGSKLNLGNPQTYNEKLQWLKLYDRNPEYTTCVDKYEVRKHVSDIIGNEFLIPIYGVWDRYDDINFDLLPDQFVLKCTHDSGGLVICKDKAKFNHDISSQKIKSSMSRNYYWKGREWPYKNVRPRIIAEKYMVDESGTELKDYKVFCFNGSPKIIQVDYNRFTNHKRNLYDINWNYINATMTYPTDSNVKIKEPSKLAEILELAKSLSTNVPHVRIDFYIINEKIFFGEMTFYHSSGFANINPEKLNIEMGSWLKLNKDKELIK